MIVTAIVSGAAIGFAWLAGAALLIAASKFGDAAKMRAEADLGRAEAEAELKLAKARSIDADTDHFLDQLGPKQPTVH